MTIDEAIANGKESVEYFQKQGLEVEKIEQMVEWLEELKAYKEAEENGLLLKLPCKVGDIIWENDFGKPCAYEIVGIGFGTIYEDNDVSDGLRFYFSNYTNSINGSFDASQIGKTVFLTREEAEQKLKEMESE